MSAQSQQLLTAFLIERDVCCPQCGYNLRNLQGTRCPECGEELVLRVNVAEPRQKLLFAGLIGLSAGAGLNGLLLIYVTIDEFRYNFQWDALRFLVVCGTGFLVEGVALLLWLKYWRWIRSLAIAGRGGLAVAGWALTLTDLVIFSFTIK